MIDVQGGNKLTSSVTVGDSKREREREEDKAGGTGSSHPQRIYGGNWYDLLFSPKIKNIRHQVQKPTLSCDGLLYDSLHPPLAHLIILFNSSSQYALLADHASPMHRTYIFFAHQLLII